MRELAPEYLLTPERGDGVTSVAAGVEADPHEWFGREAEFVVEIGSGQGHQVTAAAAAHPERDFLAVEVYIGGLARTMVLAEKLDVHNLRLIEANAPEVLEHLLPGESVSEIWIFFPDPWHKAKHNKRRLINNDFVAILARALKPGGVVRMATDWEDYAEQMRDVFDGSDRLFKRDFAGDWAPRFEERVLTAFEQKGIDKGRIIRDLAYKKL